MFDYLRIGAGILSTNVNATLNARNEIGAIALNHTANLFPEMVTSTVGKAIEVGATCLSTFAQEGLDLTSIALVGSAFMTGTSIAKKSIKEALIYGVAVTIFADNNTQVLIGLAGIAAGVIHARKANQPERIEERPLKLVSTKKSD